MDFEEPDFETLRDAIAEEMGWKKIPGLNSSLYQFKCWRHPKTPPLHHWKFHVSPPNYTLSHDAIYKAARDRFQDDPELQITMDGNLAERAIEIAELYKTPMALHRLSAFDWSVAFAKTTKIWKFKKQGDGH